MKLFNTIRETRDFAGYLREQGLKIGFVPTMGALHEGHLSLVRKAASENDAVLVSIFVNPIQFNNPEDLNKYPRNLEQDLRLLEPEGCTAVFAPEVSEMYRGEEEKQFDFGDLALVMEGAFRPGHFNGVAVVVDKLFNIALPHRAYFGEKDYQQLQIIKELAKRDHPGVEIVPCPISREPDGLARSSRNERLTTEMRKAAPYIHLVLEEVKNLAGNHTAEEIIKFVNYKFESHPLLRLEYFSIANEETLQPVSGKISSGDRAFMAVFAGEIRLIDNIRLI
jgi:pantoate--beta-alanine ligase